MATDVTTAAATHPAPAERRDESGQRIIRVALLGAGSVGSQVAKLLTEDADELAARTGARLELEGISVRRHDAPRDTELPEHLLTTDAEALVRRSDLVIELIGGVEPARSLIRTALESGADVVTANKALIATHGPELFALAHEYGRQLLYEAAVAGAIPIIRPLRDSLAGDRIERVLGIVNGTTNFILDRMHEHGESADQALATATALGYAEADPTADVGGYDAQQKAAILASIAFHTEVPIESVYREGIERIEARHIEAARRGGFVVKLLAICERAVSEDGSEAVSARVHPALVPVQHPLASVHGGNNAVFIEAAAAGKLMFYGAGAGGVETASAVLGDVVSVARRHLMGGGVFGESTHADLPVLPLADAVTSYQISIRVADEAGVLANLATTFSNHRVSVATLEQSIPAGDGGDHATLIIGTHPARERDLAAVVRDLEASESVAELLGVLRIEQAA